MHSVKGHLCTHTYPCISRCVDVVASSQAGVFGSCEWQFWSTCSGLGGERERGRREGDVTLFTARLCIAYAYLTLTSLSATYTLSHTHTLCTCVHEKRLVLFPSTLLFSPRIRAPTFLYHSALHFCFLLHAFCTPTHTHSCNKAAQWVLEELWAKAGQRSERQGAKKKDL